MSAIPVANKFHVENTEASDLELIFKLFDKSIKYQEKHGYPTWRNYDKNAIVKDIAGKLQYKVVKGSEVAIIFSVAYSDRVIWRHMDDGKAIYLHRIVVNPDFKGQKLFGKILDWAISHASERNVSRVRMDTWANNPIIIEYYKGFGFVPVENYTTPDSIELPEHNRNLPLILLEYRLRNR